MSRITEQDRHEHRQGQDDATMPFLERNIKDMTNDNPGTDSYWKGREGRDLDDDKKD
jgi:hypothetical protein